VLVIEPYLGHDDGEQDPHDRDDHQYFDQRKAAPSLHPSLHMLSSCWFCRFPMRPSCHTQNVWLQRLTISQLIHTNTFISGFATL
jgi:hypothetical protein